MDDKKQLTVELFLAAGAAAFSTANGGIAVAAGTAGIAQFLKAAVEWCRRNSAQGRWNAAIAELERNDAVRRIVREEVADQLESESRQDYEKLLATVIESGTLAATESGALVARVSEQLHDVLDQKIDQIVKLLDDRIRPKPHCNSNDPWTPPRGALPQRFWWRPKEGFPILDNGFLVDKSGLLDHGNSRLRTLAELDEVCCLILAGEPGSGKTIEIGKAWTTAKAQAPNDIVQRIDLRAYGDESRLDTVLAETFEEWHRTGVTLQLFIDSLDECRIRMKTASAILTKWLKLAMGEPDRLRVRIACRSADLPLQFEQLELDGVFELHQIAPLRQSDVVEIIDSHTLDGTKFLCQVTRARLEPLASRPVTLHLLEALYRAKKLSTLNHSQLYLHGCEQLCEETNPSRRDKGELPVHSPRELLAAAEWIAPALVFSNRTWIYTGSDIGTVLSQDDTLVSLSDLELSANNPKIPDLQIIREALGTALFTSIGGELYTFFHHTYAEFLAARCLFNLFSGTDHIFKLIMDSENRDGRVIPQLAETAVWLAGDLTEVFEALMESDPQVLVSSDVVMASDSEKVRVTEAVLSGIEHGRIPISDVDFVRRYHNLACPELAVLLRPWITDSTRDLFARRVAIEIATECSIASLLDAYVAVLENTDEPQHVRSWCAHAISKMDDDQARLALKPFVAGRKDDIDDELKGYALEALWPNEISSEELVRHLGIRKKSHFYGSYASFLYRLAGRLRQEDLPWLLSWIGGSEPSYRSDIACSQVAEEILAVAWRHVDAPGVVEALAQTAIARAEHYESIIPRTDRTRRSNEPIRDYDRRKVVAEVVRTLKAPHEKVFSTLVWHEPKLIHPDDIQLLLEIGHTLPPEQRDLWAKFVLVLNTASGELYWNDIFQLCDMDPSLCTHFGDVIAVDINSEMATRHRHEWEESQILQKEHEAITRSLEDKPLKPSPQERVEHWLRKAEEDNPDAWWALNRELTLEPTSRHYGDELSPDITTLPGWMEADESKRARLVKVARKYLDIQESKPEEWLGTNKLFWPAMAGYRAILLLWKEASDILQTLSPERWAVWAPIIVGYPSGINAPDHHEVQPKLLALAYFHAPEAVLASIKSLLEQESREAEFLPVLRKLKGTWDDRIGEMLLDFACKPEVSPTSVCELLALMLNNGFDEGERFAEACLDVDLDEPSLRERAKMAAVALLVNHHNAGWGVLWPLFERLPAFGKDVFLAAVHPYGLEDRQGWLANLSPPQIADLFLWLNEQFPRSEDPTHDGDAGMHAVSPRESVAFVRDACVRYLVSICRDDAVAALERMADSCPDQPWLRQSVLDGKKAVRNHHWQPLSPADMMRFIALGSDGRDRADYD